MPEQILKEEKLTARLRRKETRERLMVGTYISDLKWLLTIARKSNT